MQTEPFIMKKIIFSFFICLSFTICANAQILRAEELEEYAKKKYSEKWVEAAEDLAQTLSLDKNNALTYTQVIEVPNKTKEQIYILLNYWYSATFNSGKAVIQFNDKDAGVVIGKGFIEEIAFHIGGANQYKVNLEPIIKTDIKNGKIRITYTIPFYTVEKVVGGGFFGNKETSIRVDENWALDKCYPFVKKDNHKITSSKALIMAHAYSNVIMDKIEEVVKNGLVGNENEDW